MMQTITRFIELSENAISMNISVEAISQLPVMRRLLRMGEEIGEDEIPRFDELRLELDQAFTQLMRSTAQEATGSES
jgi:V/A-type H+-transporting ATPase subunit A